MELFWFGWSDLDPKKDLDHSAHFAPKAPQSGALQNLRSPNGSEGGVPVRSAENGLVIIQATLGGLEL